MKRDMRFWFVIALRGVLALLVGSAIFVVPDMARTLLLLPFAVAFTVIGLAAYGVLDSSFVFVSSYMAASQPARTALRLQGIAGVLLGVLLLSLAFDHVQLPWFLTLVALQAALIAVGEFMVARHERSHGTTLWNYTGSVIAALFAVTYFVLRVSYANALTERELSLLIYAYFVTLGLAQCLTAIRMAYADYKAIALPATEQV